MMFNPERHIYLESSLVVLGVVSALLYGLTAVQTLFYYANYVKDSTTNKVMVGLIWFADTAQLLLATHTIFYYLRPNDVNSTVLGSDYPVIWIVILDILLNAVIALIVQSSLIVRVWRLSKQDRVITVYLCIISLLGVSTSIVYGVRKLFRPQDWNPCWLALPLFIMFGRALVVDLSITICSIHLMHNRRTEIGSMNTTTQMLFEYTVNIGLLTSVAALVHLVLSSTFPIIFEYLLFYVVLPKLYTNTYLGMLNTRKYLDKGRVDGVKLPILDGAPCKVQNCTQKTAV